MSYLHVIIIIFKSVACHISFPKFKGNLSSLVCYIFLKFESILNIMKMIQLERAIEEQSNRIIASQLIPKCRDIAEQLGKGGSTSQEWVSASYKFSDDLIIIDYETYAMGEQQLRVASENGTVFEAVERVSTPPKYPNPVIDIDRRKFEILRYNPGRWEQRVETLCHKMATDVPEEVLVDAQRRFGIDLSR
jgi:hypothetical protein